MNFDENLRYGRLGEGAIALWLRRRGWNVLPAYEMEKGAKDYKGPALYRAEGPPLVAPDLLTFRGESVLWVEAKRKTAFTWYREGGRWQTGVDIHHFEEYLRVRKLSGWDVWLMFLQENGEAKDTPDGMKCPSGLFGEEIGMLAGTFDHNWRGMKYWNIEDLRLMARLEDIRTATEAVLP